MPAVRKYAKPPASSKPRFTVGGQEPPACPRGRRRACGSAPRCQRLVAGREDLLRHPRRATPRGAAHRRAGARPASPTAAADPRSPRTARVSEAIRPSSPSWLSEAVWIVEAHPAAEGEGAEHPEVPGRRPRVGGAAWCARARSTRPRCRQGPRSGPRPRSRARRQGPGRRPARPPRRRARDRARLRLQSRRRRARGATRRRHATDATRPWRSAPAGPNGDGEREDTEPGSTAERRAPAAKTTPGPGVGAANRSAALLGRGRGLLGDCLRRLLHDLELDAAVLVPAFLGGVVGDGLLHCPRPLATRRAASTLCLPMRYCTTVSARRSDSDRFCAAIPTEFACPSIRPARPAGSWLRAVGDGVEGASSNSPP